MQFGRGETLIVNVLNDRSLAEVTAGKPSTANELLSTFSISIIRVVCNSVHEAARDAGAFVSFVNYSVNSASGHGHDVTLWSFREFCDSRRCTVLRGVHGTAV